MRLAMKRFQRVVLGLVFIAWAGAGLALGSTVAASPVGANGCASDEFRMQADIFPSDEGKSLSPEEAVANALHDVLDLDIEASDLVGRLSIVSDLTNGNGEDLVVDVSGVKGLASDTQIALRLTGGNYVAEGMTQCQPGPTPAPEEKQG